MKRTTIDGRSCNVSKAALTLACAFASIEAMAADTNQRETFGVELVSHTPHLLYKLTPEQVGECPLATKNTVFFAPPYQGTDKLAQPSTLAEATVGVAASYNPKTKQEKFLECLETAWGSLDVYCVYRDYLEQNKDIPHANRPTAAFYPLRHGFTWDQTECKGTEKMAPNRWGKYHTAKKFKNTEFFNILKDYKQIDDLPWENMIDRRLKTKGKSTPDEPTLYEKAKEMRTQKWTAQSSPRWYGLWKARDKNKATTNKAKSPWEINFRPLQDEDNRKQILNMGTSTPGGLLLLTNNAKDFLDFPTKAPEGGNKEGVQQAYCCIAPFNVRVRVRDAKQNELKAKFKGLATDEGKMYNAWVYSTVTPAPKCHVLALCCDWQNEKFYDAEKKDGKAIDTMPIATSFFYPEKKEPLNQSLKNRLDREETALVPKPEFCLFDRANLAVSTKRDTVDIKWNNQAKDDQAKDKKIKISEQAGSPVAFPVRTTGACVYAIVAIPFQFSNLQEIKVSAKRKGQLYLKLNEDLIELPDSNGSDFTFDGKPETEKYKLCLAKMEFACDITSESKAGTGMLHAGQLQLEWTFIYEHSSNGTKNAPVDVTGEYSATCVDYVTVFGDSKLPIPDNSQRTDLRSGCDVGAFEKSVPICEKACRALFTGIYTNQAFATKKQLLAGDVLSDEVYAVIAFGIAHSRQYDGDFQDYSPKKSPLEFNLNKLFDDLSNESKKEKLNMRCEEEAVTFAVFVRLLGHKDITIACDNCHAWIETPKRKFNISTYTPNAEDEEKKNTPMEIGQPSEEKTEHEPIIIK